MEEAINQKLEELKILIEKDSTYKNAKRLKEKLLKDEKIMKDIKELQNTIDIYSKEYLTLKQKLYENKDYQKYQELETSLYFLTLEINEILNQLVGKKGCQK